MQDHIFRTYDIRGKVGTELLVEDVYQFACALAFYYKQQDQTITTVAVGMDGRSHSPTIKKELVRGLQDSGLNVIFIGVCPTPVLYFSQYWLAVDAALMVTASHNPQAYNGVKICMQKKSVFGEEIQTILRYFKEKKVITTDQQGTYHEHALVPEYVNFLKRLFPHLVGLDLKTVFDCGHAAVGAVLPELIKQMEWKGVTVLCQEVDGSKAVHEADPSVASNVQDLAQEVKNKQAEVGIGFDGDGDRMGAVTAQGSLVSGDKLLALYAQSVLKKVPHAAVAFDIKCSSGLKEVIERFGGNACVSPSGHAFIKKCMKDNKALLAGELSCHFFFHDRYFGYDDGVYAALRLLELLVESNQKLDELLSMFPPRKSSPELRIACEQGQGPNIVHVVQKRFAQVPDAKITTIDGVRVDTKEGWGLVRASNTQPVICLRFEANTQEGLKKIRDTFVQALQPCFEPGFIEKKVTWQDI